MIKSAFNRGIKRDDFNLKLNPKSNETSSKMFWSMVDEKTKKMAENWYKHDFEMFGYDSRQYY